MKPGPTTAGKAGLPADHDLLARPLSDALVNELSEIIDALKRAMMYRLPLPDRPHRDTVPITYVQPIMLEDAARSGVFNSDATEKMLILARNIHLYNLRVSHLL